MSTEQVTETDVLSSLEQQIKLEVGITGTTLVVKEIAKISAKIPMSIGSLSPAYAQELAGEFLRGLDLCGELVAIATAYESKTQLMKRAIHAEAMLLRAPLLNLKTAKEKEAYADTDKEYIAAADKFIRAQMFRTMVENKREDLSKAHYLMRRVSDEDKNGSPGANNNSSSDNRSDIITTTGRVAWGR